MPPERNYYVCYALHSISEMYTALVSFPAFGTLDWMMKR